MMIAICSDFSAPFYPEHTSTSTIIVPREQNQIIRTVQHTTVKRTVQVDHSITYSTRTAPYYQLLVYNSDIPTFTCSWTKTCAA